MKELADKLHLVRNELEVVHFEAAGDVIKRAQLMKSELDKAIVDEELAKLIIIGGLATQ